MVSAAFAMTIVLMAYTTVMPMHWTTGGWSNIWEILFQIWQIYIHTFPIIATLINTLILTDTIGYIIDIWMVPLIAIAYCLTSYIHFVVSGGDFQYPFLDWSKWESLGTAAGVSVASAFFYAVFVEFT